MIKGFHCQKKLLISVIVYYYLPLRPFKNIPGVVGSFGLFVSKAWLLWRLIREKDYKYVEYIILIMKQKGTGQIVTHPTHPWATCTAWLDYELSRCWVGVVVTLMVMSWLKAEQNGRNDDHEYLRTTNCFQIMQFILKSSERSCSEHLALSSGTGWF